MNRDFTMFIVDDANSARILLESAFGHECQVESFATAEDCLARLNRDACTPDLFLLDVDLPGMDGYTLCRLIKERPGMDNVPAIFISSLDDLESRLEGYDAGGTDYVIKPYNLAELKQKVGAARRLSAERLLLTDKMLEAETLSSLILSNLDEYAALIVFLRSLNDCDTPRALLDALFKMLRAYQLQSVIQLRLPSLEITVGEEGESRPLEVSVINHVRSMDRIFEFKMRAAYNFEHITLLVNNVPRHDPDLCGRLRDHLAIAAECANAKLQTLETRAENIQSKATAADLLGALRGAVLNFETNSAQARHCGLMLTQELLDELATAFASLAMSAEQETRIDGIVRTKAAEMAKIFDFSGDTQEALNNIAQQLASILRPSTTTTDDRSASNKLAIELF